MQLEFIFDDSIAVKGLKEALLMVEDTKPLMREIANHLYTTTRDSFENESSPDGRKWSPVKNKNKTGKILRDSGDLQDKFSFTATKNQAIVGTDATFGNFPYGLTHQFGSTKRNIVARSFMPITDSFELYEDTRKELEVKIEEFVQNSLK